MNDTFLRFAVERKTDVSGVSGAGLIAVGIKFPDGKCVMQWQTAIRSITIYNSIEELKKVHGHDGETVIKWLDY